MSKHVKRQKDHGRGKGGTEPWYCLWAGRPQLDPAMARLALFKTRTTQTCLSAIFILLVTLLLVGAGEKLSVVQEGLPTWRPHVDNLRTLSLFHYPHHLQLNAQNAKFLNEDSRNQPGDGDEIVRAGQSNHLLLRNSKSPRTYAARTNDPEEMQQQDHQWTISSNSERGWVQFPYVGMNETEQLMLQIRQNGTLPCHNVRTQTAKILGLPEVVADEKKIIRLFAGPVYELTIVSIGEDGQPRCAGGDYYETDLSGPLWKSRPPILDCNNGTYSVRLQMDPRFGPGTVYTFKIILLFSNFHAMHYHPHPWARLQEVTSYLIEFVLPESPNPPISSSSIAKPAPPQLELSMCNRRDFTKKYWSGRWTRETETEDCEYTRTGRWQCVDGELQCQKPWCEGKVGSLESNGWVYSAHCAFKIFQREEAWQCLDGKWLFFWGDSNHIDTIRNLLNFVLGFEPQIKFLDRRMDTTYFSPQHNRSSVRITSMFNGHSNVSLNYEGLFSLRDPDYAEQLRAYFRGETAPDFMIMNSGLHDGVYWRDVERFLKGGVEFAADFWADVWSKMRARRPDVVYRTTVTTGGKARNMSFNPHKMELFNHLIVDTFARMELERFHVLDGFDYTFPWHFDHKTNDGVHYGRPPSKSKWAGDNIGHRYFVDLMLVHILLNVICPPS